MKDTIKYIISFLLYGNEEAVSLVGYTSDPVEAKNYKIVIRPSENSPLVHPEKTWEDFYPEVKHVLHQRTVTADTDIISVACFLLSRAEEMVVRERDEHGRFLARHSVLSEGNLLSIPVIDEYSRWLLKRLEIPLPSPGFTEINLTHDVDTIAFYRHLRGALGGIARGNISQVFRSIHQLENDPAYTFPWLCDTDSRLRSAFNTDEGNMPPVNIIYFLKASAGKGLDYPQYSLTGKDFKHLLRYLAKYSIQFGLHTSYAAGANGELIKQEKGTLQNALSTIHSERSLPEGNKNYKLSTINRYHWLRSTSIDNMQCLAMSGITDDYTMGFPDHAGFRLCTTRSVRWINPKTLSLTPLTLHPLTIMDCTLSNANYMNLTEEEAFYCSQRLIDKTLQSRGSLTLLWHNSNLEQTSYHKTLYYSLLNYMRQVYALAK